MKKSVATVVVLAGCGNSSAEDVPAMLNDAARGTEAVDSGIMNRIKEEVQAKSQATAEPEPEPTAKPESTAKPAARPAEKKPTGYLESQRVAVGGTYICTNCGYETSDVNDINNHIVDSILADTGCGSYQDIVQYADQQVLVGTHEEDQGHYETSTYVDYYYCGCGATK